MLHQRNNVDGYFMERPEYHEMNLADFLKVAIKTILKALYDKLWIKKSYKLYIFLIITNEFYKFDNTTNFTN